MVFPSQGGTFLAVLATSYQLVAHRVGRENNIFAWTNPTTKLDILDRICFLFDSLPVCSFLYKMEVLSLTRYRRKTLE
jgi:hypothetical protein